MSWYQVLILLGCLSWSYCKIDKYCSVCKDHTMCQYEGIGKECEGEGESGVSEEDKKEILGMHNWLRGVVASGAESKGAGGIQPKAANLMKLEWDDELAKVAQRWADQCHFYHDTCRDDPRWKVGQNIYWSWKYPKHNVNWTEAILSWYSEVSLYDPKEVNAYRFEAATGHYTQMLWHDTYAIGCGRKDYGPNKLYVCNYGPAGNWVGEPMYEIGEPCSKCSKTATCDSYLCVQPKRSTSEETPTSLNSNFLRIAKDETTGNETENLEILKPPVENAQDVYAIEGLKSNLCKIKNQTQQNNQILKVLNDDLLNISEDEKPTTNSIDGNEIELDSETKRELEEIKTLIENLIKKAVKKSNTKQ